jgi:uncharacterized protein (TIGR02271 family)
LNPLQQTGSLITAAGRGHFERRPEGRELLITLENGQQFTAPVDLLTQQPDGQYFLNLPLGDIRARLMPAEGGAASAAVAAEELVIPVVEEEVAVGIREVEQGRVRITKTVRQLDDSVETLLERDEVEVERVPVNEYVDAPTPVEYHDDHIVIPIYEEVVVVEKRLLLKEKLVVTRRQVQERDVQPVTRRVEEAVVERVPGSDASPRTD